MRTRPLVGELRIRLGNSRLTGDLPSFRVGEILFTRMLVTGTLNEY